MPIDVNRRYSTIGEAAAAAGVSRTVVQRRVARGELPVIKMQGPRGGRPAYSILGADLAACFASKPRTPMVTGAPQVPPSPDLDDPIISAAVSAYEDAVATAIAAAETLPPAPTTAPVGRHVALLKTAHVAAPPDPYNPNLAHTPRPHDFQRPRPSRANARNVTIRDRAERVHKFLASRGEDTDYYSVDELEHLFAPLCRDGLTEYEGEMLMIETFCSDKAAGEFDEMYGDPKTRDKDFGHT